MSFETLTTGNLRFQTKAWECGENRTLAVLSSVFNIVLIKMTSNKAVLISSGLLSIGQEVMEVH